MIKKITSFLLIALFLCFFFLLIVRVDADELGPLIIIVVSPEEQNNTRDIQNVLDWYHSRKFEALAINEVDYKDSLALKTFFQSQFKSSPNFLYAILPNELFKGKITIVIDGQKIEQISDKYFENLDDDKKFISEIFVSRASIKELLEISQRKNMKSLQVNIGFAMINYERWACIPGECRVYKKCDPSYMGHDVKQIFLKKKIAVYTYFEQEGCYTSAQKPDFPLNEENIQKGLEDSNFVWYLGTKEPLKPQPEGYATVSYYNQFNRAIWLKDTDGNNVISDVELEIKKFFCFSDKKTQYNRIGFLPLFKNEKMNLNQFSTIIGINDIEGYYDIGGDGSGLSASYLAVYRLVVMNLIAGKSVGESIQVYNQYYEQFPIDKYHQENYALTLFIRGDPTLTLYDLIAQPQLQLEPQSLEDNSELDLEYNTKGSFVIKNIGQSDLEWEIISESEWLALSVKKGSIAPGQETTVEIQIIYEIPEIITMQVSKSRVGIIKIETNDRYREKVNLKIKCKGIFK